MAVKHPAKFSPAILEVITSILDARGWPARILDPFAGVGRVHRLAQPHRVTTIGVELEPEWATEADNTLIANTLNLPFPDQSFDGMVTSPCYGNRLADHHHARDGSHRRSYTHDLGRRLHRDNSGAMQWNDTYRDFHHRAWTEVLRVMQPGALLILNVSNHIRGGEEQHVTEWHHNWFMDHGCFTEDLRAVTTPRLRDGANHNARVAHENVFALRYVAPVLTPETEEPECADSPDPRPTPSPS